MRQVIGRELARFLTAMRRVAILHSSILNYTCATGHLECGPRRFQSIIVRAVTPDHPEGPQYHVLPDDPLRALNILREAAGLPPLSDEHYDEGG